MLAKKRATASRPSYSRGIGGIEVMTSFVSRATSASTSAASYALTNLATIASSAGEPGAGGGSRPAPSGRRRTRPARARLRALLTGQLPERVAVSGPRPRDQVGCHWPHSRVTFFRTLSRFRLGRHRPRGELGGRSRVSGQRLALQPLVQLSRQPPALAGGDSDLPGKLARDYLRRGRDPAGSRHGESDRAPQLRFAQRPGAQLAAGQLRGDARARQDRPAMAAAHELLLQAHGVGLDGDVDVDTRLRDRAVDKG